MEFGVFFLGSCPDGNHRRLYDEMLEQAAYAEELGFSSIWLAEHHGSNYGTLPSPPVFAAAIAQRTKRVRIGIAVSILPFQNPVRIAEDWAMVDVLTGGRLDFGAGRGYQPREFRMLGADPTVSREVFAEALEIILGLWNTEDPFSFRGKHFAVEGIEIVPRPVQRPIPVWVAALSKPTFKLVAEKGLQILSTPTLLPMGELNRSYPPSEG